MERLGSYKVCNLQEKMPAISRKPNREMLTGTYPAAITKVRKRRESSIIWAEIARCIEERRRDELFRSQRGKREKGGMLLFQDVDG